ncbi:hypothetical protein Rvan_0711 [Rhodomicrobium vannielii ATCC 17100]|jgi:hypothetical protein|uniref:Uncharacterized protein n=1 Tax=Rhodomicrobium vannielii (strain ATCC 17100 / DSM 162 / LMG 4299 / NCIMB 10020 / ATH 3.1.1) TaxID=648757 RepID=E3I0H7_RHOVT|nr:hypothetical protein Rvan_0711 [Rhodomicrobium vannielii ATCC 17100]
MRAWLAATAALMIVTAPSFLAEAASLGEGGSRGPWLARFSASGGQCPKLCVEWFDGCNNCSCGRGRIDVCTQHICFGRKRARCLRWGF